jgi:hypothetical protein
MRSHGKVNDADSTDLLPVIGSVEEEVMLESTPVWHCRLYHLNASELKVRDVLPEISRT